MWGEQLREAEGRTASTEQTIGAVLGKVCVEPVLTAHPTEAKRLAVLDQHRAIYALLAVARARDKSRLPSRKRCAKRRRPHSNASGAPAKSCSKSRNSPTNAATSCTICAMFFPRCCRNSTNACARRGRRRALMRTLLQDETQLPANPLWHLGGRRSRRASRGHGGGHRGDARAPAGECPGGPAPRTRRAGGKAQPFRVDAAASAIAGRGARDKIAAELGEMARPILAANRRRAVAAIRRAVDRAAAGRDRAASAFAAPRRRRELSVTPRNWRADLQTLRDSLIEVGAKRLAETDVRPVLRALQVFGFHLAQLDIRQNSVFHAKALSQLMTAAGLDGSQWEEWSEAERLRFLEKELRSPRPFLHARRLGRTGGRCGARLLSACSPRTSRAAARMASAR